MYENNIKYLNCGERYEDMIDLGVIHTALTVVKLKPQKKNQAGIFIRL